MITHQLPSCTFTFIYLLLTVEPCNVAPQVAEGVWEPCQGSSNASSAATKQYTVGGRECIFPGVYGGQTITQCTALEPGMPLMCPVSAGRDGPL